MRSERSVQGPKRIEQRPLTAGQFTNDRDFPKALLRLHNERERAQALLTPGLLDDEKVPSTR